MNQSQDDFITQRHPLLSLLVCPCTGADLVYHEFDRASALISALDGRLYPIIDGVVVMAPVAQQVQKLCKDFLDGINGHLPGMKEYDADLTKATLFRGSENKIDQWHAGEMEFWEEKFRRLGESEKPQNPGWNRTLPRQEIIKRLPEGIQNSVLLEIGCGASHTLYDTWQDCIPNYIGLDLSFYACLLTKRTFPHGLFIQASAENPPFKRESIDNIFAYGAFHHLPDHEGNILHILKFLRPGGHVVGADPLLKEKVPRLRLRDCKAVCNDGVTRNSPHNEWIDWQNLLDLLGMDADVVAELREYSPLRSIMVEFLYDGLGLRNKSFVRLLMLLDRVWLDSIGKCHGALGPAAIHYAIRKR